MLGLNKIRIDQQELCVRVTLICSELVDLLVQGLYKLGVLVLTDVLRWTVDDQDVWTAPGFT